MNEIFAKKRDPDREMQFSGSRTPQQSIKDLFAKKERARDNRPISHDKMTIIVVTKLRVKV